MEFLKAWVDYKLGNIKLVRVERINGNEMVLVNGMAIRLFEGQLKNIPVGTDQETGEINYQDVPGLDERLHAILVKGNFTGLLISVGSGGLDAPVIPISINKGLWSNFVYSGKDRVIKCMLDVVYSDFGKESLILQNEHPRFHHQRAE